MPNTTQAVIRLSGPPGTTFRVVPRTRGDEEISDVVTGRLDSTGTASFELPTGYFVVLAEGLGATPLQVGSSEVLNVTLTSID